jgi:histidinol-phosphate aminotransferase
MTIEKALTRRGFAGVAAAALTPAFFTETAFAQRAAVRGNAPPGTVWLNSNEFPEGPPPAAIEAMTRTLAESNRYHYQEFRAFYSAVAASEKFDADSILVGSGSTEILHCAIDAFTSEKRPFITSWPTYEAGPELAATKGAPVVKLPLTSGYGFDVKKLAEEAEKAAGGLIYICNPNNPTASMTPAADIAWLVKNLPRNTQLLVDEAYLHFHPSHENESALRYVRDGKDVIVARTFSKIYGMAGLRVGFALARPDLIQKMQPYRNNVIGIVSARAVLAALDLGPKFLDERRAKITKPRNQTAAWCREKNLKYIESNANFMMIDVGRPIRDVGPAMLAKAVAVGRAFPPYDTMMRVTVGTDEEMAKFRTALGEVLGV